MKVYRDLFERIASPENLFAAWDSFKWDKRNKPDVRQFEWNLEEKIFALHRELVAKTYRHGPYVGFYITDPKQRHIHKATVRDRILHHAVFSVLNPIFEETFIATSFSCRIGYGTHKGIDALGNAARRIGRNNTRTCLALKCDIKKFFDSVDHDILLRILSERVKDTDALWLLRQIVESFGTGTGGLFARKGLPIGNLTSQLFANVYLNEFDHFMKREVQVRDYFRYTDDFVILSSDRAYLEGLLPQIDRFLTARLRLTLHPRKVTIRRLTQGIDFLGYVTFPYHRLLRATTRRRMFRKLRRRLLERDTGRVSDAAVESALQSYLGVLSHANARALTDRLKTLYWLYR